MLLTSIRYSLKNRLDGIKSLDLTYANRSNCTDGNENGRLP